MNVITSKENETIKQVRKLKEKKYRDESHVFLVEGMKMVDEALQEEAEIQKIFICEDCVKDGSIDQKFIYKIAKQDCVYVTEPIFKSISEVTSPQGILAVVAQREEKQATPSYTDELYLALDGIQDPGNLGTIIRTADSAGIRELILSPQTADPYNPKVVRSTMGAIFRMNFIQTKDFASTLKEMQKHHYQVLATSLEDAKSIYEVSYQKKVLVIGNEANGVSKEVQDLADQKIKIPMLGKTESLNASVAAGIVVYEAVRQKLAKNKQ